MTLHIYAGLIILSISEETLKLDRTKEYETVTFRVASALISELRTEADQKSESLNVLVNQVLNLYIKWNKPSHKAGNIDFSRSLITRIFQVLSDEQIATIADEYVRDELKETVYMLGSKFDLSSYLDIICVWFDVSGFAYRYEKSDDKSNKKLSVRFDMGRKWSFWFDKFVRTICKDFKVKSLESEISNNGVMFEINEAKNNNV